MLIVLKLWIANCVKTKRLPLPPWRRERRVARAPASKCIVLLLRDCGTLTKHSHKRGPESENGDESGTAVPQRKLYPQGTAPVPRGAASGQCAPVEERLSADTEHHHPRLVLR